MHTQHLLALAGIRFQKYPYGPSVGVYLTAANQVVGSRAFLEHFQGINRDYPQWVTQPLVELQDLQRPGGLQLSQHSLPCLLLPQNGRTVLAQSVLRMHELRRDSASPGQRRRAYAEAFALLGNYSGGGTEAIRRELAAIVDAAFRLAAVPA